MIKFSVVQFLFLVKQINWDSFLLEQDLIDAETIKIPQGTGNLEGVCDYQNSVQLHGGVAWYAWQLSCP